MPTYPNPSNPPHQAWEDLGRPRDELGALLKARGNVRCDLKKFSAAVEDYDRVLALMASDGTLYVLRVPYV